MFKVVTLITTLILVKTIQSYLTGQRGSDKVSGIIMGRALGYLEIQADGTSVVSRNTTQFPYTVALIEEGDQVCGGSLVKEDAVITAAHCYVLFADIYNIKIHAGRIYLKDNIESSSQIQDLKSFTIHENFTRSVPVNEARYDIALIKTKAPFKLNKFVGLVKLPNSNEQPNFTGKSMVILGWGLTEYRRYSDFLRKTDVKVLSEQECKRYMPSYDNRLLCTKGIMYTSTCLGDSGGPLVIHNENQPDSDLLVGVVSFSKSFVIWGSITCSGVEPNYQTNVIVLRDWIDEKLNEL